VPRVELGFVHSGGGRRSVAHGIANLHEEDLVDQAHATDGLSPEARARLTEKYERSATYLGTTLGAILAQH
jgi:hypothetical protein